MTFGKQARVALQDDLFKALAGFWQSLRRSAAPTPVKLAMLPIKAWAKVLHGGAGCVMSEARLGALRAKATQAIGIRPAGASSSLRLTCSGYVCGSWVLQLWHLVNDLRRLGKKQPDLIESWAHFVRHFEGRYFPGPFSSLLQLCTRMRWS